MNLLLHKKGLTGISTLLLVMGLSAIAVMVSASMLATSGKLTGQATIEKQIVTRQSSNMKYIEIDGLEPRNGYLTYYTIDMKLNPGSAPLSLNHITIDIMGSDFSSSLKYRENSQELFSNNSGYNTWSPQEFGRLVVSVSPLPFTVDAISGSVPYNLPLDLDGDTLTDSVFTCPPGGICPDAFEDTHLRFNLSSTTTDYYAELRNLNGSLTNISTNPVALNVERSPIDGGWGFVSVVGNTGANDQIGFGNEVATLYLSAQEIDTDLDDDGADDVFFLNETHVIFDISSITPDIAVPLGVNLSSGAVTLNVNEKIQFGNEIYGTLTVSGDTAAADIIPETVNFTITPYHLGNGYYHFQYLSRGSQPLDGFVVDGDIVRFYVESYRGVYDREELVFSTHTPDGTVIKRVYTGEVLPALTRYVLFPQV